MEEPDVTEEYEDDKEGICFATLESRSALSSWAYIPHRRTRGTEEDEDDKDGIRFVTVQSRFRNRESVCNIIGNCVCDDSIMQQLNLYLGMVLTVGLQCLRAIVQNGRHIQWTHSFVWSWVSVSVQIAKIMAFWLCLSETYTWIVWHCLPCK